MANIPVAETKKEVNQIDSSGKGKTEEKKDDKSFFDSIFSKEQTYTLLDKFSSQPTPQLTMATALEHKCKIRAW